MNKKLIPTESQEQANFVNEVRLQYRNDPTFIYPLFFSTLNGAWLGGKSFAIWQKHQKEGAVQGVSDILYLQSRGNYSFFAAEMKRSDRRNQKDGGRYCYRDRIRSLERADGSSRNVPDNLVLPAGGLARGDRERVRRRMGTN